MTSKVENYRILPSVLSPGKFIWLASSGYSSPETFDTELEAKVDYLLFVYEPIGLKVIEATSLVNTDYEEFFTWLRKKINVDNVLIPRSLMYKYDFTQLLSKYLLTQVADKNSEMALDFATVIADLSALSDNFYVDINN
jgi:hypothetical protein